MIQYIDQFREAIAANGLNPPTNIVADGILHRFSTNGKSSDDSGWYVLHADGAPAGCFGCWRRGVSETWRANIGRPLTHDEEQSHKMKIEAMQREREVEKIKRQAEAAIKAAEILKSAKPANENFPYLRSKKVKPHGVADYHDRLIVPMRIGTELHSLQFIDANGDKRFLPGGRVTGCYYSIGDVNGSKAMCIVEGFATGATIHEATGYPVAVAFNAGNLSAVAKTMRDKFPDLALIVCTDDDHQTEGNPGVTKATEAAKLVNGVTAIPQFGANRPEKATDFNDLAALCGLDEVARNISETLNGAKALSPISLPTLVCAADVRSKPIDWLWYNYLAGGKFHVLGGAPGTGKTTLALALAATISTAGRWPDGTLCCNAGDVIMWSGEDDIADTLKPRLDAMEADLTRVHFVASLKNGRSFDPARDMDGLAARISTVANPKLLIVDPIVSAVMGDSHKNAEVRRALQPLVDLAEKCGLAVIGITHFSKGTSGRDPLERLTGSLAFGALARLVWCAAKLKDENGDEYRAFVRIKSNIGPDGGGFRYDLKYTELNNGVIGSRVLWGEAIEGEARAILATDDNVSNDEGSAEQEAASWLRETLATVNIDGKQIKDMAKSAGIAERTLYRASKKLGVKTLANGFAKPRLWHMCAMSAKECYVCQSKKVGTHEKLGRHANENNQSPRPRHDTTTEQPDDVEVF